MRVVHVKPEGWADTEEAGVIQPSHVAGLVHQVELEEGDLLQGPQGEPGPQGAPGPNVAGMVAFFARASAPAGWLVCDGSLVSRAAYPALFAAVGVVFGAGDGVSTFGLPDLRGEFVRGLDGGRGVDAGRVFGSLQSDAFQGHKVRLLDVRGTPSGAALTSITESTLRLAEGNGVVYGPQQWENTGLVSDGVNGVPRVAKETRPRNVALLPCIAVGV